MHMQGKLNSRDFNSEQDKKLFFKMPSTNWLAMGSIPSFKRKITGRVRERVKQSNKTPACRLILPVNPP